MILPNLMQLLTLLIFKTLPTQVTLLNNLTQHRMLHFIKTKVSLRILVWPTVATQLVRTTRGRTHRHRNQMLLLTKLLS